MAGGVRLSGGLQLESHKTGALQQPLRTASTPATAVVALDQGGGHGAVPLVSAGTRVFVGTPLARPADRSAATVHSPISGLVREIGDRPAATTGGRGNCIVIDSDGADRRDPRLEPPDWESLPPAELIEGIREAGIVGLGGAAFSTAAKLAAARESAVDQLVLNGAECEPWIACDDALMRERAGDVLLGAQVMLRACGAGRATIAVEDDKPDSVRALEAALEALGDERLELVTLPSLYPAGAERQLLAAVTGREVPHDALPPTIGLLCQNVGTAAAVAAWARTGTPCIGRVVTVTGSGVRCPANLEARIGTALAGLVADCGGYRGEPLRLIAGGSMTGAALATDEIALNKGMNCILVATGEDLVPRAAEMPCIRCGDCAVACPAWLLPQQLHRAAVAGDTPGLERHGIADCIECGCCDYVCPSNIPLTEQFRAARAELRVRAEELRRATEARLRFERHQGRLAAQAEAERQAFEDARRRARGEGPV